MFENLHVNNLSELAAYLDTLDSTSLHEAAQDLVESISFHMWVYSLGYAEQVIEWRNIYEKAVW